jgi:hypothetical protein
MRPLLQVFVWLSQTAQTTYDLTFRASPLRGIAPSRFHAGSSAFLALLLLITCTSPSSRQRILGITPGLCFLRNPSPYAIRLAPAPVIHTSRRGHTGLLRSQFPWITSVGRCSPPGLLAVQTGQYRRLPAPYPVPFGSSASASCAGSRSRWLNHTFACAAHRCLRDGIPGWRLPGSAVYPRFRPLRTSRRPGGYAVTPAPGGRDLHPHGKLSYKVHHYLAVYPEAEASFRPTDRTSMHSVLATSSIKQPNKTLQCEISQ